VKSISYIKFADGFKRAFVDTNTQGRNKVGQEDHNSPCAESLQGAPKSPNNVTSTFFNTAHFFQKTSGSKMGAPNLLLALGAIEPRYAPANTFAYFCGGIINLLWFECNTNSENCCCFYSPSFGFV